MQQTPSQARPRKLVASIQSSYIPWKGYFDIINMVDEFVLYDDAQYVKKAWRNRNLIKTPNGCQWLTIPVRQRGRSQQKVSDVEVANTAWARKHWSAISQNYRKAKYFPEFGDWLEALYSNLTETRLSQINFYFLSAICRVLGISTKISWSTDFTLSRQKTERVVELCEKTGATEFISGPKAKEYYDEELFHRANIKLVYVDYSNYPAYRQLYGPFEHHVSIVDLILNEGPAAGRYLKSFGLPDGDSAG